MKNIIFIGMPAVGKSTVGVVVAKRLGYEFIDTDLLIQKQENRLLREIIAEEGLDGFLSIENQVNRDVYDERVVLFEKYADITVSEDGLELEETIENVMEVLENQ